jgi:hypothetical protein
MLRWFRIAVTLFAVAAACALVAMWVRSYKTTDVALHGPFGKESFLEIASNRGRVIALVLYQQYAASPRSWETRSVPVADGRAFPLGAIRKYETVWGFGIVRGPIRYRAVQNPTLNDVISVLRHSYIMYDVPPCSGVIVPYWFLVLLCGALTAAARLCWPPRISMRGLFAAMTFASVLLGLVSWLDLGAPR